MVLGLAESDLGQDIQDVARRLGVGVQADPEPQRVRFVRSDLEEYIDDARRGWRPNAATLSRTT